MRVKRGNVDRSDIERALLTDTGPLDVPIIFSNDGFYANLKRTAPSEGMRRIIEGLVKSNGSNYTIPLRYRIRLTDVSSRQLSMAHPAAQYHACIFYSTYGHLLPYFCRHAAVSLRRPIKIGSTYFYLNKTAETKRYKGAAIDMLSHDEALRNPGSYFAYEGYDRFYKFFNSDEFVNLEKTFSVMRMSDVSKCFSSIYSHTLAWAVKDIQHGKESTRAKTFANDFDSLMQFANYNETNGIPVGAEVSRIFAEIILQSVEVRVLRAAERNGLKHGLHFAMRRYIDDYIIFANSEDTLDRIQRAVSHSLLEFNLYLNEAKTLTIHRPLQTRRSQIISGAAPAIAKFRDSISCYVASTHTSVPKFVREPQSLVRVFVNDIKVACVNGEAGYDDVTPYVIGSLTGTLETLISGYIDQPKNVQDEAELYARVFDSLLSALYYFFTVHPTVTASYQVAKATVLTVRFFKESLSDGADYMNERVRLLIQDVVVNPSNLSKRSTGCVPIELLNIILASTELPVEFSINVKDVKTRVLEEEFSDYFSVVSMIFYSQSSDKEFLDALESKLRQEFLPSARPKLVAHDCHLMIDLLSCPYLSRSFRSECAKGLLRALEMSVENNFSRMLLDEFKQNPWFVNWQQIDLLNHLKKKELRSVY